jgi:phage RecT family recombinase
MGSELAIFEAQLKPLTNQFEDVLADRMPVARLTRTLFMACEKTPKLLDCNRQSLINAGMTFAVLALETDGVTGQGYLLPFANVAQPVIGYKGYNTIGARSRITITGNVVREGDVYDFDLGEGWVKHKSTAAGSEGRIIAAWAKAAASDRPAIVEWLWLPQLEAVKKKSPGAKKSDSPWNDPGVGLPAMYGKTAKRRLARSTPMEWARPEFQLAARMEEAFDEQGRHSFISPTRGVVIEGDRSPIADREPSPTPDLADLTGPRPDPETVELRHAGDEQAAAGMVKLQIWWKALTARQQHLVGEAYLRDTLKPAAEKADNDFFEGDKK